MKAKKKKKLEEKRDVRYIPLDDIKALNDAFLTEMLNVKQKLNVLKDKEIIQEMQAELLKTYRAAIAIKTLEREVDYDKKLAEIKARADEQRPVHRSWLWRLIGCWVTNRAQDIIEERAELDAESIHTAAEKQLDADWERLFPKKKKKLSRREKRQLKKQLEEAIRKADEMPTNEVFEEPPAAPSDVQTEQENAEQAAEPPEPPARKPRKNKQQSGV